MYADLEQVVALAEGLGWQLIDHQENICMISFGRNGVRLNYYYSKGTVGTAMRHPTKGKTQLFRKHVSFKMFKKLSGS